MGQCNRFLGTKVVLDLHSRVITEQICCIPSRVTVDYKCQRLVSAQESRQLIHFPNTHEAGLDLIVSKSQ